jgi:hypothetical protein
MKEKKEYTLLCFGLKLKKWYYELSLSQPAKPLVPSYYCLYSLYNKIRDKGKIVSAGY